MKKILILLLGIISCFAATADVWKQYDKILVLLNDGTSYEIPIDEDSYIYSFLTRANDGVVRMVEIAGNDCLYQFYRSEITSIKYLESYNSIMNVPEVNVVNKLQFKDGYIKCNPLLVGKQLFVYDLAGRMVMNEIITIDSAISVDHLLDGVYIAKVDEYTIKIIKQ